MTVQSNFRKFVLQYLSFMDIEFYENQSGLVIKNSQSIIYCPLDEFYGCFMANDYNCIYVVKEIFGKLATYCFCEVFGNTKFINISEIFSIHQNKNTVYDYKINKKESVVKCELDTCFYNETIEKIIKKLEHKNEKYNLICQERKNVIIKDGLTQIGLLLNNKKLICSKFKNLNDILK